MLSKVVPQGIDFTIGNDLTKICIIYGSKVLHERFVVGFVSPLLKVD